MLKDRLGKYEDVSEIEKSLEDVQTQLNKEITESFNEFFGYKSAA